MNLKVISKMAISVAVVIAFAAGCSGKKSDEAAVPYQLMQSPDRIVKLLMSDFQFNNLDDISRYFSSEVPEEIADRVCNEFVADKRVGRFESEIMSPIPFNENAERVEVQLIFNYTEPDAPLGKNDKKVEKTTVTMVPEMIGDKKIWKIRSLGLQKYDDLIEEGLFVRCLDAVMDTSIAMEIVRATKDSYASSIAELLDAYSINENACEEITIVEPTEEQYSLHAVTTNLTPCNITFTADADADPEMGTDSYSPKTYSECKNEAVTQN